MAAHFLIIFTFLLFQRFGTSSNTLIVASSNVTCIESERRSLVIFKQKLTDRLNRLSTWSGLECCEWQGVECDWRNGHVVKLDLRSTVPYTVENLFDENRLRGELSPSLLSLKHLRYLDLSMNNFSGVIPEFLGSFKRLEYLNLSRSGLDGVVPPHLGNLSRLQYLDLNNEAILESDGSFSYDRDSPFVSVDDLQWVSSLYSLKHLDLSWISISVDIDWFDVVNMLPSLLTLNLVSCIFNIPSVKFVNFTSLSSLDLSQNVIDTTLPLWLSNLTELMHLHLEGNRINGQIPDFLGRMSSLASIYLSDNSFNTSMPESIWNLSSLITLDLNYNKFHGSVPPAVKLCNLTVLKLKGNEFSGDISRFIENSSECVLNSLMDLNLEENEFNGSLPNKLGEFKKLEYLRLSLNDFSGPIPPSLGSLSFLREMNIGLNRLSGSIPESFGLLSRLEKLSIQNNQLTGTIPTSLSQLSNLDTLYASQNLLVGILSERHFSKLKNLVVLSLASNSLALNVSSQWVPPFQLQEIDLGSCNIGPYFPKWLQTQIHLHRLDLSNSSIRDIMPNWFGNISSNIWYLDLSHNEIGGKLPEFHDFNKLHKDMYLLMNSNKFEGSFTSFPSNVTVLDLSENLLSGHLPHIDGTMNLKLEVINLSKNRFTGIIPMHLCTVLSIKVLDLSQNKLFGRLPRCFGNLTMLQAIDLTNNTITGVVPSSLSSLENLQSLHLHNNIFEGNLPMSLQNLTELVTMDLGNNFLVGSIPSWIGEKLSNLKILNLQSNKFTGKIPLQICHLNTLQILNLAQNDIRGMIPHCFGNLSGMITNQVSLEYYTIEYYEENILASIKGHQLLYTKTIRFLTSLDLSSNKIDGEIPDVLMNLVGLKNLNLSRNMLKGNIPMMTGNLKQIESLDLSMNKLSGRIPQSLSSLNYLSYLNVSFNNLFGAIPFGNQIQTLDDPSFYEGNNGLCGPPLLRSCKSNDTSYNHVGEEENGDDSEQLWFYAGMGPGFGIGFLALLGSLLFIKTWRLSFFAFIENICDRVICHFKQLLCRL